MSTTEHPAFDEFVRTVAHLRAPQGGCPWNQAQTHETLGEYLVEEAYETLDAIESHDADHLREELGDVLLQVVLQSQVAADAGTFTIDDVCNTINDKMIRRHPHVFGMANAQNANEVADLWEQVKLAEKAAEQKANGQKHLLDDVPTHFPALLQAQKISRRAVAVGFEWDTLDDVWNQVAEERAELQAAYDAAPKTPDGRILDDNKAAVREAELEFGDLLFALVNVARKMGIDAESALRASNQKFRQRFALVEDFARQDGQSLEDTPRDQMEEYWEQAKRQLNEQTRKES